MLNDRLSCMANKSTAVKWSSPRQQLVNLDLLQKMAESFVQLLVVSVSTCISAWHECLLKVKLTL